MQSFSTPTTSTISQNLRLGWLLLAHKGLDEFLEWHEEGVAGVQGLSGANLSPLELSEEVAPRITVSVSWHPASAAAPNPALDYRPNGFNPVGCEAVRSGTTANCMTYLS
jgi:hypothetical protein